MLSWFIIYRNCRRRNKCDATDLIFNELSNIGFWWTRRLYPTEPMQMVNRCFAINFRNKFQPDLTCNFLHSVNELTIFAREHGKLQSISQRTRKKPTVKSIKLTAWAGGNHIRKIRFSECSFQLALVSLFTSTTSNFANLNTAGPRWALWHLFIRNELAVVLIWGTENECRAFRHINCSRSWFGKSWSMAIASGPLTTGYYV